LTSENEFVRRLARRFPVRQPVEVGIGDDGAVLRCSTDERTVIVTDMLLDGVHFELREIDVRLAGRKAIAVNLSDLAAMACLPTAAFVSIAVPKGMSAAHDRFLDDLYSGIEELTREYDFCLAGGDTNTWHGPFAINVCLTGRPMRNRPVLRSGARVGDSLFVTGPLGGSLRSGRHLIFSPAFEAAQWLVDHAQVNAMMDISDGLSMDLHRMMAASHAGAILNAHQIPIHDDVSASLSDEQRLHCALADGEDFELLLSVPAVDAVSLRSHALQVGLMFYEIGTVVEGNAIRLCDEQGHLHPLTVSGWEHQL